VRKSNTYFEQIPVETVKRIVEQLPENGISTQQDWRELAERVQQETDPNRMIDLVQQLITKLDEEKLRKGLTPASRPNRDAAV
jgi:sensor domain CHASE-containing protein